MARRFPTRGFTRGSKRQTSWEFGFFSTGMTAVPANSVVLLASITAAALDDDAPATIIRTRGVIGVSSDQTGADEQQLGGVGLTLVNDNARISGVAAVPAPVIDLDWDGWFVHQLFVQRQLFASNIGWHPNAVTQYEVDSKAMRKFTGEESLVLVAENTHPTHGLNIAVFLRILIKAG